MSLSLDMIIQHLVVIVCLQTCIEREKCFFFSLIIFRFLTKLVKTFVDFIHKKCVIDRSLKMQSPCRSTLTCLVYKVIEVKKMS